MLASYIQLHMYGFLYSVGLFGSSRSIEFDLRGEELGYKSCETKQLKPAYDNSAAEMYLEAHISNKPGLIWAVVNIV